MTRLTIKRILYDPWSTISYINLFRKNWIIKKRSKNNNRFFFIQIGANDGVSHDPIRKFILEYNWSGILVEPQKDIFNKLKNNYKNRNNLIFENLAISKSKKDVEFYISKDSGLSSLHNDDWFKNRTAGCAYEYRKMNGKSTKIKVNSLSLMDLIQKHGVKKIDLLQIDTEGYDFKIIKMIDFSKIKPSMICYEDHHLDKKEKRQAFNFLKQNGYKIMKVGSDTFAF